MTALTFIKYLARVTQRSRSNGASGARRQTQEERRERSTRRLLDAATQLIADQGFTRTSLAQIGKAAGYSRGLVNERFGSKTELVRVLAEEFRDSLAVERLDPALEGRSGLDALIVAVETYLDSLEWSGALGRAYYELLGESLALIPEIQETFLEAERALRSGFRHLVEDAVASGEIPADADTDALATVVVGILRGVSVQWLRDPAAVDRTAVRREIRRVLERAFGRPDAAASSA